VLLAREQARQIAAHLSLQRQDQIRLATAVCEMARNAFRYAGEGRVEFLVEGRTTPQSFVTCVTGRGLSIPGPSSTFKDRHLVDDCEVHSIPLLGTTVKLKKLLPAGVPALTAERVAFITEKLSHQRKCDPFLELHQQNNELMYLLQELRGYQEELLFHNQGSEDPDRGAAARHAALDEKARCAQHSDELRSRVLLEMGHELRLPLSAILALSKILLDGTDGQLTTDQTEHIRFILKAAQGLSTFVDDFLDLARIDAGKIDVHQVEFTAADLFRSLRELFQSLLLNESVTLIFEEPRHLPMLYTDEGKVSQILRNFLSNALKYTDHGEVRVSAVPLSGKETVTFSVADTGIGIASKDQERIFEPFVQLKHPFQKRAKGTGLGLALSKRLATLLGGCVSVTSQLGVGSIFSLTIPVTHGGPTFTQLKMELSAVQELER
jgi:signal transduction histidine kinase